jgi:CheY-like chemotaxis protein
VRRPVEYPSLRGRNLLVIEDEEGIRELVQEGLVARGLSVECAASIAEAIRLSENREYDAIICDLHLPDGNGSKVLDHFLQRRSPAVPSRTPALIFMTGDVTDSMQLEHVRTKAALLASAPPIRILHKPFQISALVGILEELLAGLPVR